jgi:hypothetical protein
MIVRAELEAASDEAEIAWQAFLDEHPELT